MDELSIEFGLDDLEVIEKLCNKTLFPYPVVHASKDFLMFNTLSAEYLPSNLWIKWFVSSEYIIGLPASALDKDAFKMSKTHGGKSKGYTARFPLAMSKERGVREGFYKLYKYKDGIAFKRYEPIQA